MISFSAKQKLAGYLFILPGFSAYVVFTLIPILITLGFSVTQVDRFTWTTDFVALDNFLYVFSDPLFWKSFGNTFLFVVLAVVGNVGLGLLLAVMLNGAMPKLLLYGLRFAYFLPVLVPTALVALVWRFLYSTDLGVLNYYLAQVGIPDVGWLTNANVALFSLVIMDIWKHCGFYMIILLAAVQGVPRSLIEAATLDGAGPVRIFASIIVPMISPVLLFCIAYATIAGLQVFEAARVLTMGGPGDATRTAVMYLYEETFNAQDLGTGSAAAVILLVGIIVATALQFSIGRRETQG